MKTAWAASTGVGAGNRLRQGREPFFHVGNRGLQLLTAHRMFGGVKLPLQLSESQFEGRDLRIFDGIDLRLLRATLPASGFALVSQFLNSRVRVNKAFACVTHDF